MFAGFNRETRNSVRLHGARVRYASGVVEFAAEQAGASVPQSLDLRLSARGGGVVRAQQNLRLESGRIEFQDAAGYIERLSALNSLVLAPSSSTPAIMLSAATCNILPDVMLTLANGAQVTREVRCADRANNSGDGHNLRVRAGAGSTVGSGSAGGRLWLQGGAANGTGNNAGGDVLLLGGAPSGTGARGAVALGWDGANAGPVTVRGTKLSLRGYSESGSNPTTTQLPADGDFGVHKNTSSGTVFLAFNDAGTIRTIAFT